MIDIEKILADTTFPKESFCSITDEKLLYDKLKKWINWSNTITSESQLSIQNAMLSNVNIAIQHSIDRTLDNSRWIGIQQSMAEYITYNKTWDSHFSQIRTAYKNSESMRTSILDTIFDSSEQILYDAILSEIKNTSSLYAYLNAYSKFTSEEFESFLHPTITTKEKNQLISIHAKFKYLDWFWNQGLCCSKGLGNNEYFITSYYGEEDTIKITIGEEIKNEP